jgi:ribosomal protein L32
MKHKQHIPERVEWYTCNRCGEAKRPHRICTKHLDMCALRDEEYEEYKERKAREAAEEASNNSA